MKRPLSTLCLLSLLFTSRALPGDVIWKVADEGPRAAIVDQILGDDTRTIAFSPDGEAEFDGTAWHPVVLNTRTLPESNRVLHFLGGRFIATATEGNHFVIFTLQERTWVRIASIPWTPPWPAPWGVSPGTIGSDRFYLLTDHFDTALCAPDAMCPPDSPFRRLVSISLADGSTRDEPRLPACTATMFFMSGRLYLIETPPFCPGPSRPAGRQPAADETYPFYRLDGDRWTALEPWTVPPWEIASTPNALWIYLSSGADLSIRVFTEAGLSPAMLVPRPTGGFPTPLELGGRMLLVSQEPVQNLYEVKDGALVHVEPSSPVAGAAFAAGSRLFTVAEGWNAYLLGQSGWAETPGLPTRPGAQAYVMGKTRAFGSRGTRVFRRDGNGWTRLAPPPPPGLASLATALEEEPVIQNGGRLFIHETATDSWKDLGAPSGLTSAFLVSGGDLYAGAGLGAVARLHAGSWSLLQASPPPDESEGTIQTLREIGGAVYAFSSHGTGTGSRGYRVESIGLAPAFPYLAPGIGVRDAVEVGGRTFLTVDDPLHPGSLRSAVMASGTSGYETVLTEDDLLWAGAWQLLSGTYLAGVEGALLSAGLAYDGGRLRAQRSPIVPRTIDSGGRFAFGDLFRPGEPTDGWSPLLVPERRVRKVLAAVVDVTGFGGTRYRSTLALANFSSSTTAVARVFAGAGPVPVLEIPLGPGAQKRIEDPAPGFLGPLVVDFDGLSDEQDAWTAVRVWNPSDGGTAGTSLVGTDPGGLSFATVAIPPVPKEGSRTHLALSAPAGGSGQEGIATVYGLAEQRIPSGGFRQVDPSPDALRYPFFVENRCILCFGNVSGSDLVGYFVRNEAGTNDGTVVSFDAPVPVVGRRTRFLPAIVATESPFGFYRTELTLGWRSSPSTGPEAVTVTATFRTDGLSRSFPVTFHSKTILPIPDAGAWLQENGVPVDPTNVIGTLTFTSDRPEGAANLLVTAVVTARGPGASGDYGVGVSLFDEAQWASTDAIVPGLLETALFRSNLAVASPEPDGGPSVTLEVSIRRASDGTPVGALIPIQLSPGQRVQLNRLLATVDYSGEAYAVITRTAGAGRFVAYGVVNDNVTGDGTLFPMTRAR